MPRVSFIVRYRPLSLEGGGLQLGAPYRLPARDVRELAALLSSLDSMGAHVERVTSVPIRPFRSAS